MEKTMYDCDVCGVAIGKIAKNNLVDFVSTTNGIEINIGSDVVDPQITKIEKKYGKRSFKICWSCFLAQYKMKVK